MKLHSNNHEIADRDDGELPPALAILAEQLRDDAARLSACYPPRNASLPRLPATAADDTAPVAKNGRLVRRVAAAVLIAGSACAIYAVRHQPDEVGRGDPHSVLVTAVSPHSGNGVAPASGSSAGTIEATVLFNETGLLDESGFESLSRPTQEAVLDLFEDDVLAQGKLSI